MFNLKKEAKELIKGVLMAIILYFIIQISLVIATGVDDPISVVISGSMDHRGYSFDDWWDIKEYEYLQHGITKEDFSSYEYKNGFSRGDILFITEVQIDEIRLGDVIVFVRNGNEIPIVHRVVDITFYEGSFYFLTKGDYNPVPDNFLSDGILGVHESAVIGQVHGMIPQIGKITLLLRGAL